MALLVIYVLLHLREILTALKWSYVLFYTFMFFEVRLSKFDGLFEGKHLSITIFTIEY